MTPTAQAGLYFILAAASIYLDLIYIPRWISAEHGRRRRPLVWVAWAATTALSATLIISAFVAASRMR